MDDAERKISLPYDPKRAYDKLAGDFKFNEDVHGFRSTVNPQDYAMVTPFSRPVIPTTVLRGMPTVLPIEKLAGIAGRGPVPMDQGGGQTRGQRWIMLKGLVPVAKQKEQYKVLYGNASYQDAGRDTPKYFGFLVERVDVTPDTPAAEKNKFFLWMGPAETTAAGSGRGARQGEEVVAVRFVDPVLTAPLLQVNDRTWGEEVAISPEIPLGEKSDMRSPGGRLPDRHLDTGGGADTAGKLDDLPDGAKPNKALGTARQPQVAEDKGPEYLLLRYFDLEVQPGRQYRYRVFPLLANPNEKLDSRYLTDANSASGRYIGVGQVTRDKRGQMIDVKLAAGTDWSPPTPGVAMPEDAQLLAFGVQMPTRPGQEPTGTIRVVTWSKNLGINAWSEFSVVRGKIADFPKTEVKTKDGRLPVDFITGNLIVDLAGDPVKDHQPPERPIQIAVLEPSGKLVIHDKDVDEEAFKQLVPPERKIKVPPKPPPGGHRAHGVKAKTVDEFDDGGVFDKGGGKAAGKR